MSGTTLGKKSRVQSFRALDMVEHVLIRLAEIRAEAAQDEWERSHPCRLCLQRRLRRWWIQAKLAGLWLSSRPAVQNTRAAAVVQRKHMHQVGIGLVLRATRLVGMRPPRSLVLGQSVKTLITELELRGCSSEACVEKSDLLDVLCGPASSCMKHRGHPSGADAV
jgi:hypothetical protein